jgi:hypothetical protein
MNAGNSSSGWMRNRGTLISREPASPFRHFYSSRRGDPAGGTHVRALSAVHTNREGLLFERRIEIRYGTVRLRWNKFGLLPAGDIRGQRVSRRELLAFD